MKRLLALLLLTALVLAVEIDPETGCEKYSDHVICPKATDVETAVKYAADSQCYSIQNEYGTLEDVGCYADATLAQPLSYQACKSYVPFTATDIDTSGINDNYACATEQLASGEAIVVIGYKDQYTGCTTVEEDEYYGEYTCPVSGQKYAITGSIMLDNGTYSLLVASQEAPAPLAGLTEALATPLAALGVAVLAVYAWYVWSQKKKK